MLLALVLASSGVTFFTERELPNQTPRALQAHLIDVDDELAMLKRSLQITSGEVFLAATTQAAPFVLLAGAPALLIGFLVKDATTTSGPLIGTGILIAGGLLLGAVFCALVYAVGRLINHAFETSEWTEREKKVLAYRPLVVNALGPVQ